MGRIVETIITTTTKTGEPHLAPLGLIAEGEGWIIAPFKPSRTLDNLRAHPFAVASHTDDVRVFAGAVTGRKSWPLSPIADGRGARLAQCLSHWELDVERVIEDDVRPRFLCRVQKIQTHAPWAGFNRAEAAVLELAVLTTRLHMLPADKVESELKYLEIAIAKTAGPREEEAWSWLMEKITVWRASVS